MTDMQDKGTEGSGLLEGIRELRHHYQDKKHAATLAQDEIRSAYFAGQVSGLVHAEEAIKEAKTDG